MMWLIRNKFAQQPPMKKPPLTVVSEGFQHARFGTTPGCGDPWRAQQC